jgi:DNA polymerase-1
LINKPLALVEKQMRLLIIDGHAFAYRAFYGIRGLTSPAGRPTNAIYGFISMLAKLEAQVLPTHAVVVWDGGLDAGRVESLDDYKGQRDPMPDDMEVQLDSMVEYLEAEGWASVCDDGVEADDRIGQLAKRAEGEGYEVAIASSDKDFLQLINDRVKMWNPADKSGVPMDAEAVVAKTGVRPEQIVDWLSLVGDAADNIPGVPGVIAWPRSSATSSASRSPPPRPTYAETKRSWRLNWICRASRNWTISAGDSRTRPAWRSSSRRGAFGRC